MAFDPSLAFLLIKMLTTAAIVVAASLIAERTGPLIAALVATLPVSAGPVYAFLALAHDDAFIAGAALGSMAANLCTAGLTLVYVLIASRLPTLAALALAISVHLGLLALFRQVDLPFPALLALTIGVFTLLHLAIRPYLTAKPKSPPKLAWYAIPLRAAFVAALTGLVTTLSTSIGSHWSGLLATFPVVLSTLILFLQPRIGGPATAAILASGVLGLFGFGIALAAVHLLALPLGKWPALAIGLGVCVVWNLGIGGLAWLSARTRASTEAT